MPNGEFCVKTEKKFPVASPNKKIVTSAKPNAEVRPPKNPASRLLRLLTAFVVSLFCLFLDSIGLLEWIPLPGRSHTVFLFLACLVTSVVILYPTSFFDRCGRAVRIGLLFLLGIGIEVCASALVLILFMVRNDMFPKN